MTRRELCESCDHSNEADGGHLICDLVRGRNGRPAPCRLGGMLRSREARCPGADVELATRWSAADVETCGGSPATDAAQRVPPGVVLPSPGFIPFGSGTVRGFKV